MPAWIASKACKRCEVVRPLADFYAHPTTRDRRQGVCALCRRLDAQAMREARIDERRAYDRRRYKSIERREYVLAVSRARHAVPASERRRREMAAAFLCLGVDQRVEAPDHGADRHDQL
jgi:hypothetical protein